MENYDPPTEKELKEVRKKAAEISAYWRHIEKENEKED